MIVVTTSDLPRYKITEVHGSARGITVRSRSVLGNISGQIQSLFGGNLSVYTNLAETARQEAYDILVRHAADMDANAIIAMRYDANDTMDGMTEVLAYGTAVTATKA